MATLRTFIAIELNEELRACLGDLQDSLDSRIAPKTVRWVRPEGIHLTLKFLGDTPEAKLNEIGAALALAASEVAPFSCTVGNLGCFPNAHSPRVLWVGLQEPTGTLVQLRDALEAYVAPLGFPTERRRFHPHLTLGRVQRRASRAEVREVGRAVAASAPEILGEMSAASVSFIGSDLLPGGAVYTTLAESLLAGGRGESRIGLQGPRSDPAGLG